MSAATLDSVACQAQESDVRIETSELGLDTGIAEFVSILRAAGIETFESCEGGPGHCFPEPTVRFHGHRSEGFRALAVAQQHGLPVAYLRRYWSIDDGEPCGPRWELVFWRRATG
jgi:hypothetical protein